jgi:hypothetical protein
MKNLMSNLADKAKLANPGLRCPFRSTVTETVEQFQAPARFRASRQRSPLWFLIEMRSRRRRFIPGHSQQFSGKAGFPAS